MPIFLINQMLNMPGPILTQLIANETFFSTFEHPEEIYCLSAWIALQFDRSRYSAQSKAFAAANQQDVILCASNRLENTFFKIRGVVCLQLEEWQQADQIFLRLLQNESYVSSHGEAWFWRAYSAGQQNQTSLKKEYLQQAYTQDAQSPYAPIAYFQFYSYREYMQGKRKAIKHLQAMPLLFPHHPLIISAYYLIGLNYKKDHLSEEGQILRRKDWTAAIDAIPT